MADDQDRERLESLSKRIDQARQAADPVAVDNVSQRASRRQGAKVVQVGSDFVALIVLSGALGWYLDGVFDTKPWLMLALLVVGFILGFWVVAAFLMQKTDVSES
jgi:ATP synthase protein I